MPRTCAQCGDTSGPFVRIDATTWICEGHVDEEDGQQ